jgi:prolyl 4-hydroxylase
MFMTRELRLKLACGISIFVIIFVAIVRSRRSTQPSLIAVPIVETFEDSPKVCNDTFVIELPNLLTPEQCDAMRVASLKKGMEDSTVGETDAQLDKQSRRSTQAWFDQKENEITKLIERKALELVGRMPDCFGDVTVADNFENIQVVRYTKDGKYDPHYDGTECGEGTEMRECLKNQRMATLLIYLNDDFEGGETRFPNLNRSIKPKKGSAVFFWVSDPKTGMLFKETLHGGDPVLAGEKWIATQWIRRNAK